MTVIFMMLFTFLLCITWATIVGGIAILLEDKDNRGIPR